MKKVINIPIEPLEDRYSTQWDGWFKSAFALEAFETITVYGTSTSGKINIGSFLDVFETNQYKLSQLQSIIEILKSMPTDEHIVLFFHDLWFPGLETIAYLRQGVGFTNLKICGCLHAGTYDPFDFLTKKGMEAWGKKLEESWFVFIDKIFVATKFHKELLTINRDIHPSKIQVTGFPIFPSQIPYYLKENIIVFPHRLDSEKNPDLFDLLSEDCATEDWQFIKSKAVCATKSEYYDLLARSKIAISFAEQETWGIAMQEAVFAGCLPLVPNRLSYIEMYAKTFRYTSYEDCVLKLKAYINSIKNYESILIENAKNLSKQGREAIPRIINKIKTLC